MFSSTSNSGMPFSSSDSLLFYDEVDNNHEINQKFHPMNSSPLLCSLPNNPQHQLEMYTTQCIDEFQSQCRITNNASSSSSLVVEKRENVDHLSISWSCSSLSSSSPSPSPTPSSKSTSSLSPSSSSSSSSSSNSSIILHSDEEDFESIGNKQRHLLRICINDLIQSNSLFRQRAIRELCKLTEVMQNIGSTLWFTPSVMQNILMELCQFYEYLHPPQLTKDQVQIICSILALLQQIVLDKNCRESFLSSRIQFYVIPFFLLDVNGLTRDLEHLRVCLLSFFATITQKLGKNVVAIENYLDLFDSEILRFTLDAIIRCQSDVGRSMAVLLLHKLLQSHKLIDFIALKKQRFKDIGRALAIAVFYMSRKLPNAALLANLPTSTKMAKDAYDRVKRVLQLLIRCYIQLSANDLLCRALAGCLPREFTTDNLCQLCPDCQLNGDLQELWSRVDPTPSRILCERKLLSVGQVE